MKLKRYTQHYILLILCAIFIYILYFSGLRNALVYLIGIAFGILFVYGSVGFTSAWRELITKGDPIGMNAQLLMLAIGVIIFIPLLNSFPTLHKTVAPLTWSAMGGAFLFGIGMQLGDGCGSGSIAKIGYNAYSRFAIIPFIVGSTIGTMSVPTLTKLGGLGIVDLGTLGIIPAISIQIFIILFLYVLTHIWKYYKQWDGNSKWNYTLFLGVIGIALLSVVYTLLSGQQWGITYAFGLWGTKILHWLGVDVIATFAFWQSEGNQKALLNAVTFDVTSLSNIGLILGAILYVGYKKQSYTQPRNTRSILGAVLGGLCMGYGAQISFGCNIGAYFSGVSAGSLHGWAWFIWAFMGTLLGIKLRKYFQY